MGPRICWWHHHDVFPVNRTNTVGEVPPVLKPLGGFKPFFICRWHFHMYGTETPDNGGTNTLHNIWHRRDCDPKLKAQRVECFSCCQESNGQSQPFSCTDNLVASHDLMRRYKIGRAHVWTPVTPISRMPSSAWKKKQKKTKTTKKKNKNTTRPVA